ncbi:hypothetical protein D3C71_1781850 [compost metagenome]
MMMRVDQPRIDNLARRIDHRIRRFIRQIVTDRLDFMPLGIEAAAGIACAAFIHGYDVSGIPD